MKYGVLTIGELDQLVYNHLLSEGAAKPSADDPSRYEVLDREAARSTRIMPLVLNVFGAKGWKLTAVNNMECFIFTIDDAQPVEYLVRTPPELDRDAMSTLAEAGYANVTDVGGEKQTFEITSPDHARIQEVLPKILADIAIERWQLAAISGPQLYFFTRPKRPVATTRT
jgi:hypothetical protein